MKFNEKSLADIANIKTGKLNSNAAVDGGKYPFFTCAPEPLKIDNYKYDQTAILLAGNNAEGNFHINFYEGKFEAYQRTYIIDSKNENEYDLRFLYYALKECLAEFKAMSQGTSTKFLTMSILNSFKLNIPSIVNQKRIARILALLDEKIENNKKINNNLASQMQAIFINVRDTSNWHMRKLDEVLTFFDYLRKPLSSMQREKMAHIYPYYGATTIVDYVENYLFEGVYILVSEDGANVVDSAGHPLIQYTHGKFWVNNHAHIVKGCDGYSEALIYALMGTLNMQNIVTGAAQPKINQANLRNFEAKLPALDDAVTLSEILDPMLKKMIHNDQENERLAELRNSLLPQLMSGEFDVSAIEI